MAPRSRSTSLPHSLTAASEMRSKHLGYRSWNDYVKGLIRRDLISRDPHCISLVISRMRPEDQDLIDADLEIIAVAPEETARVRIIKILSGCNEIQFLKDYLADNDVTETLGKRVDPLLEELMGG